jgi:hypothetical protein
LLKDIQAQLIAHVQCFPILAFVILEKRNMEEGPIIFQHVQDEAFSQISWEDPRNIDEEQAFVSMGQATLESMLSNATKRRIAREIQKFNAIRRWECPLWLDIDVDERREIAKELVKDHVRLDYMNPPELSTTLADSGLVEESILRAVHRRQGLRVESAIDFWKATTTLKKVPQPDDSSHSTVDCHSL